MKIFSPLLLSFILISSSIAQLLPTIRGSRNKECRILESERICPTNEQLAYAVYNTKADFMIFKVRDTFLKETAELVFKSIPPNECRSRCWKMSNCKGFRSFKFYVGWVIPKWQCELIHQVILRGKTILDENEDELQMISCCKRFELPKKWKSTVKEDEEEEEEEETMETSTEKLEESQVVENTDENKSLENNEEKKAIEDTGENKAMENSEENKAIEDSGENKSMENSEENKAFEKTWDHKAIHNHEKNKAIEDTGENKSMENSEENKAIEGTGESKHPIDISEENKATDSIEKNKAIASIEENKAIETDTSQESSQEPIAAGLDTREQKDADKSIVNNPQNVEIGNQASSKAGNSINKVELQSEKKIEKRKSYLWIIFGVAALFIVCIVVLAIGLTKKKSVPELSRYFLSDVENNEDAFN